MHIDIDTAAISRNVQVDVLIVADAKEAIEKMLEYVDGVQYAEMAGGSGPGWKQEHLWR